jgi:hypothetical protein
MPFPTWPNDVSVSIDKIQYKNQFSVAITAGILALSADIGITAMALYRHLVTLPNIITVVFGLIASMLLLLMPLTPRRLILIALITSWSLLLSTTISAMFGPGILFVPSLVAATTALFMSTIRKQKLSPNKLRN